MNSDGSTTSPGLVLGKRGWKLLLKIVDSLFVLIFDVVLLAQAEQCYHLCKGRELVWRSSSERKTVVKISYC